MKIGVVGPFDSTERILEVIEKYYPNIETVVYVKEKVNEVGDIIDECLTLTNGIIFTGCAVLSEAEKAADLYVPCEAIARDGSSIMKAFWDIYQDNKPIDRISIDLLEKDLVDEIVNEFNLDVEAIYNKPYDPSIPELEYQKWHQDLLKKGDINLIITAFGSVYNELVSLGLPVYRLNLTVPLIKKAIDNLIYKIKNREMEANQIGIQIFKIKNIDNIYDRPYDQLVVKNIVEKEILVYAKEVQGSMFKLDNNKYILCSTRRTLENDQNINVFQTVVRNLDKENISICSGMGFGYTGWDAERNSKDALSMSEKEDNGALFIIDQEKRIKGPINHKREKAYDLIVTDERLIKISNEIGISPTYLSKLLPLIKESEDKYFSADILADYLNISHRSARRILTKFEESNYGEVVTTAVTKGVGRPKKIVRIKI
ncbi:MAG: hypothetical protein GX987_09600 [Tissierellia bacterium]|nr:hypothetical protein [Tissierellia bacterium]